MNDLDTIFERLARSPFRRRFRLQPPERAYLASKGLDVIMAHGAEFVRTRLAAAQPENDGRQTPMRNHPIFVAQHATATCCRGCLAKWHGIPKGYELTDDERAYIQSIVRRWLTGQMQVSPQES